MSLVVPAYRAEATIAETIQSALAQTMRDFEVIVVDDGSPDASGAAALAAAAGDDRVRVIRLPENRGVSSARNAGFAAAVGTWTAPLDADDALQPNRLETLLATVDATPCDVLIDDLLVPIDGTMVRAFGSERMAESGPIAPARYAGFDRPNIGLSTIGFAKPLFRTAFLREHGVRYREHVYAGEDFDIVMQALLRGADLRFTPYAGYVYRRDRATLSLAGQERVRSAMLVSSRELRAEAAGLPDRAAAEALDQRERDMLRWFDFDAFYDALRQRRFATALARFRRIEAKRYAVIRLAASIRYDVYLALGISLEKKKRLKR